MKALVSASRRLLLLALPSVACAAQAWPLASAEANEGAVARVGAAPCSGVPPLAAPDFAAPSFTAPSFAAPSFTVPNFAVPTAACAFAAAAGFARESPRGSAESPQGLAGRLRVFSTQHYDLWIEAQPVEAEELGFVLEAAWREYQSFFKAAPPEGTRLKVKLYATEDAFLQSAWSDGAIVPAQCRPALWSDQTSAVYLYGPALSYTTRKALIFATALQFHALCKSKNKDLQREWYEAGLAHAFSRHTWDGRRLVVMTRPLVEPVDYPLRALHLIENDPAGLPRQLDPDMADPILCWAAVGLCRDAAHGRYRTAFEKYVMGATGSKIPGEDFLRSLGPINELARALVAWLDDEQTPFEMVSDEFEDRGARTLRGTAEPGKRAYCILKDTESDVLECTLGFLPKLRARAGLVTGYYAKGDYVLISVVAPTVDIHVWQDFKLVWTESIDIPGDHVKERRLKITRKGVSAHLEVDGLDLGTRELPQGRQGFFVEGGTVTFRDVNWK